MAVFAIPNPTKNLTVNFSLEQTNKAVTRIPLINKKYKFTKSVDAFNQTTLESFEFLSLGVFIDFTLKKIDDTNTEINIEVRRKVGSFDQSFEITNANEHIQTLITDLSNCITKSDEDFDKIISTNLKDIKKQPVEVSKATKLIVNITLTILAIGLLLLVAML